MLLRITKKLGLHELRKFRPVVRYTHNKYCVHRTCLNACKNLSFPQLNKESSSYTQTVIDVEPKRVGSKRAVCARPGSGGTF
jgi:hypothetical protein